MSENDFHIRQISGKEDRRSFEESPKLRAQSKRQRLESSRFIRFLYFLSDNRPRTRKEWRVFLFKGLGGVSIFLVLYFLFLWITLPDLSDPASLLASQSTVITDRNGVELYRLFSEEDRTYIPGDKIPISIKHAAVAIEDERFYDRGCLDIRAITRAILLLGQAGGGSTITRQLARNALNLQQDNRFHRKVKEIILGCQLEHQMGKDQLLELYLNWIPFGQNAYGIEQASQAYFGKSASGLTLAESSILASLPQRPSYFSPYGSHVHTDVEEEADMKIQEGKITKVSQISDNDLTIGLLGKTAGTGSSTLYVGGRTDQVLKNMQEQGFISENERLQALEELETIEFRPSREDIRAPHFVLWVKEEVERMFSGTAEEGLLEQGGLKIETTLDWNLQEIAEKTVAFHQEDILNRFGAHNIALFSMDPETREVLAYIGNTDYDDQEHGGKIDMALVPRQPGSSFKPIVYAAAFQEGYGPATVLYDVPTKIGDNEPQNFDGTFWGLTTMRKALGGSRNIPAAKTFFLAGGEDNILQLASALGAPTPIQKRSELALEREDGFEYGWPLALGAAETPLIEMVQAYDTFASGGAYRPPQRIRRITDKNGNILFEAESVQSVQVLDPRIAYQITSVLSDESVRPNEYWRNQLTIPGFQTAAKTGTSNKCLEWANENLCKLRKPDNAWVIGYTPSLITGVWTGNADSSAMFDKGDGLNTSSPIWRDYMIGAHRKLEGVRTQFPIPSGIVQPQISLLSGELPTECTPVTLRQADVFLEESAPSKPDPACAMLTIDKVTKLLASEACPSDAEEEGSFLVVHDVLPERFPDWEKSTQEWFDHQMELWYAAPDHSGAIIPLPRAPTESCDPSLTPGRLIKPEVTIHSPQASGTASYPSFKPSISYTVGSIVNEVIFEVDGKEVARRVSEPFDAALRVPRSISDQGTHVLTVTVVDEYFNRVSASINFHFGEDTGVPTVEITDPSGDQEIQAGEALTIRATASDSDRGIKYVQFYLGDTLLTTKPKEPFEFTYTFETPGTFTLRAVSEDLAENTTEDSLTVVVK